MTVSEFKQALGDGWHFVEQFRAISLTTEMYVSKDGRAWAFRLPAVDDDDEVFPETAEALSEFVAAAQTGDFSSWTEHELGQEWKL